MAHLIEFINKRTTLKIIYYVIDQKPSVLGYMTTTELLYQKDMIENII